MPQHHPRVESHGFFRELQPLFRLFVFELDVRNLQACQRVIGRVFQLTLKGRGGFFVEALLVE